MRRGHSGSGGRVCEFEDNMGAAAGFVRIVPRIEAGLMKWNFSGWELRGGGVSWVIWLGLFLSRLAL